MRCWLYGLASTKDGKIRYVGQTKNQVSARFGRHLLDARRKTNNSNLAKWIRSEWAAGNGIKVIVINQDAAWNVSEREYIAAARERGDPLINIMPGGTWGSHDPKVMASQSGKYHQEDEPFVQTCSIDDLTTRAPYNIVGP